ncbi:IAA19 - auxin-responsive Aux/IAA family member [Zea mays]|uniref:Auxin-responsive protein n=1 Tax=Zea mays TaxID=4577 RepID=A0A1D6MC87_MAIZE|nr:IAA19 - auxin-responsive Aux/IAA family member [Zea mays]AQK88360.1 Auxin-responsive protein IAA27 [Zea mays]|eukprot:NP_001151311.2 IAA19 - auxin-responsive Aux/IAA family member [Zea mays]
MPPPLLQARDYMGAGATPLSCSSSGEGTGPHLALRLGLPGSDSPGRDAGPEPDHAHVDAALTLGPAPAPAPAPPRVGAKRGFADSRDRCAKRDATAADDAAGGVTGEEKRVGAAAAGAPPAAKAQVVGWPPVRSYRKNTLAMSATKTNGEDEGRSEAGCCYVKVSMDGAPYLRKVDLKTFSSYEDLSLALEKMFTCFITGQSGSCKTSRRERLTDGSRADALQDQEYVLTYEDKDADWMLVGDLPWDLFTTICGKLRIMRGSDAAGMAPRSPEQIVGTRIRNVARHAES